MKYDRPVKGPHRPPTLSFREAVAEFGVPPTILRNALRLDPARPKPAIIAVHNRHHTQGASRDTYYVATEIRTWWRNRSAKP